METTDNKGETTPAQTAANRYATLEASRQPFLNRARECAALSIPAIMPPQGHTGAMYLKHPFQSTIADGVNNLAAKLLLALFPPGQSFFRLALDDFTLAKLKAKTGDKFDDARAAYEDALSKVERTVVTRMEQRGTRTVRHEAVMHLIITGNALTFVRPDNSEKFFALDRYVVKRDLEGDVLEIIVKECLARVALPPRVQAFLQSQPESPTNDHEKNVDLYTWIRRNENASWSIHQEVEGSTIPGTEGSYPKDKSPWIPLRWAAVSGEDYGRGRIEEYLGASVSAEALQQAIVEIAAQAAKVHWLVDENGQTDKETVAKAPNGAVYHGNATKDVTVLMLDKMQDFQVAKGVLDDVKQELQRAFLSATAVQRDAERVTAEEIRAMIAELEQGLGGVYAVMAVEWQYPLANRHLMQMMASRQLPQLPADLVSPQIVTGMDGLSRQSDLQKLDTFIQGLATEFGPPVVAQYINVGEYIKRRGAALGIDMTGLVKPDAQVQQEAAQQQQSEMAQKLGPAGIKAASDVATKGLASQQAQPQGATSSNA